MSRFTEQQMVTILREADRATVAEAAKKHKVSEPTIYAWRKHFGRMESADVKRLKALEQENARLKKLLAESALDIQVLKSEAVAEPPPLLAQLPIRIHETALNSAPHARNSRIHSDTSVAHDARVCRPSASAQSVQRPAARVAGAGCCLASARPG
jgi:putative transposase